MYLWNGWSDRCTRGRYATCPLKRGTHYSRSRRRSTKRHFKYGTQGSLTHKTAAEVMEAIKKLAVRGENTMVAQVQLHNMCQDWDETIRSFGARLRGQAGICKFLVTCPGCNAEE